MSKFEAIRKRLIVDHLIDTCDFNSENVMMFDSDSCIEINNAREAGAYDFLFQFATQAVLLSRKSNPDAE